MTQRFQLPQGAETCTPCLLGPGQGLSARARVVQVMGQLQKHHVALLARGAKQRKVRKAHGTPGHGTVR